MAADDITVSDVAAAIAAATGDESLRSAVKDIATRLELDLCLDSLDLTALAAELRCRYGTAVDLCGYVCGLDIDEIIQLSVGDVADYVNRCRQPGQGQ